jgi:hypothetical protein
MEGAYDSQQDTSGSNSRRDNGRTTRRAVAAGAGAAAAGAYVAPGCVQVVDAYGRLVTRC